MAPRNVARNVQPPRGGGRGRGAGAGGRRGGGGGRRGGGVGKRGGEIKLRLRSLALFGLDLIPFVGTVKQGYECYDAICSGDNVKAIGKGVGTAISAGFDLSGASSLYNMVSYGVKEVAKIGTREMAEMGVQIAVKELAEEVFVEKFIGKGGEVTLRYVLKRAAKEYAEKQWSVNIVKRAISLLASRGIMVSEFVDVSDEDDED